METNEAPEKIYITNYNIPSLPKEEQLSERWHEVSTQDTDIEYIRADAFIEKAVKWIKNNGYMYNGECEGDVKAMAEDFVNYMKAEEKDLCKKCKHYWVDFRVNPDKEYVPRCEIADKKISYEALDDIVLYPCLECPFNSFKEK